MEQQPETFSEDRELIEKLAKLQDIHQQITDLRGLLPERLMRPTRIALENPKGISPEKLAINLRTAASDGSRDIQRFKKDFQNAEMRELFQRTSNAEIAQGRDSWNVDYQSLAKAYKADNNNILKNDVQANTNSTANITSSENEIEVLKRYQESQSNLKLVPNSSSKMYPLKITVSGLSFTVDVEERNGTRILRLADQSAGPPNLSNEIAALINDASTLTSLELLLNMLASYHDFKFKACDKCSNIFDDNMRYPIIRQQETLDKKDNENIEWAKLHRGCI